MSATWAVLGVILAIAGTGWGASDYVNKNLASKESVMLAMSTSQYVLDRQMDGILRQIAYLEAKRNKTRDEIQQFDWLRETLKEMRNVRRGK